MVKIKIYKHYFLDVVIMVTRSHIQFHQCGHGGCGRNHKFLYLVMVATVIGYGHGYKLYFLVILDESMNVNLITSYGSIASIGEKTKNQLI